MTHWWVPWLKFSIPLAFAVPGLWTFLTLPFWPGLLTFLALFITGSVIGNRLFKRYAALDQIKADLEARLHND